MTKGSFLSPIGRKIVYELGVVQLRECEEISLFLQQTTNDTVAISTLRSLIAKMKRNVGVAMSYCTGSYKKRGRNRSMSEFQHQYLISLVTNNPGDSLDDLKESFNRQLHGNNNVHRHRHVSTIRRALKRSNITRKKLE